MADTVTRAWDASDYLKAEQDQLLYLDAAFEEGDARLIAAALGDIAQDPSSTIRPYGSRAHEKETENWRRYVDMVELILRTT